MWRRKRAMKDLDDDIRDHIARETEEHVSRGMPPDEARRQAQLTFGSAALAREDTARVWAWAWADQLRMDVRHAGRTLRRNRAFAATAAATLALAIGANTLMFSVLNAVVLRPLPYRSPEQLAMLWAENPAGVALVLTVVATAACYFPARRAMRIEVTDALRQA